MFLPYHNFKRCLSRSSISPTHHSDEKTNEQGESFPESSSLLIPEAGLRLKPPDHKPTAFSTSLCCFFLIISKFHYQTCQSRIFFRESTEYISAYI